MNIALLKEIIYAIALFYAGFSTVILIGMTLGQICDDGGSRVLTVFQFLLALVLVVLQLIARFGA